MCRYRKTSWWHIIDEKIILGGIPMNNDLVCLKEMNVKSVLSLNEDFEFQSLPLLGNPVSLQDWDDCGIKCLQIPTKDGYPPSFEQLQQASDFIHESNSKVYVHCKAGVGRSAMVLMAYYIDHHGLTARQSRDWVQSKRNRIRLSPFQWKAIQYYETHRHMKILS